MLLADDESVNLFVMLRLIYYDLIVPRRHTISIKSRHILAANPLFTLRINPNFEIMMQIPSINLKVGFAFSVAQVELWLEALGHLAAIHEVEHDSFELGHQSFFTSLIDKNFLVRGYVEIWAALGIAQITRLMDLHFMV